MKSGMNPAYPSLALRLMVRDMPGNMLSKIKIKTNMAMINPMKSNPLICCKNTLNLVKKCINLPIMIRLEESEFDL